MEITYHIWAVVKDPTQNEIHKHLSSINIKGQHYFGAKVAEMDVVREIVLTEAEEIDYCKGIVEGTWQKLKADSKEEEYNFQRDNFNILVYGTTEKK